MLRGFEKGIMDILKNHGCESPRPLGVIGHFHVIINREERIGEIDRLRDSIDFIECLNECGLQDAGFTCSKVTWCDNRDLPNTIRKRP